MLCHLSVTCSGACAAPEHQSSCRGARCAELSMYRSVLKKVEQKRCLKDGALERPACSYNRRWRAPARGSIGTQGLFYIWCA